MNRPAPVTATAPAGPALRAEGIAKAFVSGKVRTQVLDGLSLSIEAGELTLISGPSGCGKSTLLAILSGLQKVDAGRVIALGSELGGLDSRALERFRLLTPASCSRASTCFPRSPRWSRWNCRCTTWACPAARRASVPPSRWTRSA